MGEISVFLMKEVVVIFLGSEWIFFMVMVMIIVMRDDVESKLIMLVDEGGFYR